jgi:murein DD-endopeptidase MepM/ murein hydrolase activator NlpD
MKRAWLRHSPYRVNFAIRLNPSKIEFWIIIPNSFAKEMTPDWNYMLSMLIGRRDKRRSGLSRIFLAAASNQPPLPLPAGLLERLRDKPGLWMKSLYDKIEAHKYIRLRQRYIINRQNRIRLRYVTSVAACFIAAGITAFGDISAPRVSRFNDYSSANYASTIKPASGSEEAVQYAVAAPNIDVPGVLKERISDSMRRASLVIQKAPKKNYEEIEIGRGDTLAGVLQDAGLNSTDSYQAVKALSAQYDPRGVKPGQKLSVHFKPGTTEDERGEFTKMVIQVDPVKEIVVSKSGDTFKTAMSEKKLVKNTYAGKAKIETSLYGSAARAGIPSQVIAEMIRIYSWNIDFQRDIQPGDKIEVMYEAEETEDGEYAKFGNVLYANLTVGGREVPIYRYEMADGRIDYFQPDGMSTRKTLMKTPIDGARISSGYGLRRHPVLGYNKMHKGIDFAAPTGTPIYAAGEGVLEYAGRFSSYGNYIRIRHNSKLKTAYAHMHRLAKGMSVGKRVHQGDVIGYVGTTGRSTGPHLHYEVMVNNATVNPRSVTLPTGEQLTGKELQRFKSKIAGMHQQYVSLVDGMKLASGSMFFPDSAKGLN